MNARYSLRLLVAGWATLIGLSVAEPAMAADNEFKVALSVVQDRKAVFATVESVDTAAARTRIGGTISGLEVDEGSRVNKGQRLARVEDAKLRLRMRAINARMQSLQAQKQLAETALDRYTKLRQSGTISQARLDQAQTDLDVVDRELAAMNADRAVISQQQAEGAVLAPADGRVLKVHVTAGTNVQPGEVVATLAADAFILRMFLPERHARFIRTGDEVLVGKRGLDGSGESKRSGTIRQVYPEMDQGRVVADVDVAGLGDFFVGERVPVYVTAETRTAYLVPPRFLFRKFGVTYANLKGIGEVVVQTGETGPEGTEILSGLRDGDILMAPGAGS